ncbi:MAG TPA: nucleotidyltransferase family protein [Candidatus Limnocylindrales bacterium]|nr:nucleotidyltransferase family protein [Candidatus Limnocylindrales bacterium]
MRAFILAGGFGTRLRGILDVSVPKPMAPVAGRPFIEYLVRQLERDGIREVTLLTGHGADVIERYFGTGGTGVVEIAYSREPEPLGTGGALRLAASRFPGDRYLVMNGDTFFDIPLPTLIAAHDEALDRGARVTMALASSSETARFGTVDLDRDGSVTRFVEKDIGEGGGLINAGIAVVESGVLLGIPDDRAVSLEREILPRLVRQGLHGRAFEARFVDIGVPEAYRALSLAPDAVLASVL